MADLGIDASALSEKAETLRADGQTAMFVSSDGKLIGLVGVADPIKPSTPEAIQTLLDQFHWEPSINWSDDKTAAYVLGVCQRLRAKFTLSEIVARMLMDKGFTLVRPLAGGLDAWIDAGYPVELAHE